MKRRKKVREIALPRIERLLELAEADARKTKGKSRSDRYVQLAREIGMRYRVRIPPHLKMRICKWCYAFLIPGKNARVRLRGDYITTTCLCCGAHMRRPYKAPRAPSPRRKGRVEKRNWQMFSDWKKEYERERLKETSSLERVLLFEGLYLAALTLHKDKLQWAWTSDEAAKRNNHIMHLIEMRKLFVQGKGWQST